MLKEAIEKIQSMAHPDVLDIDGRKFIIGLDGGYDEIVPDQMMVQSINLNSLDAMVQFVKQFSIGSLDILPFQTFHDAQEPLGFVIQSRVDGDIFAFATDTVNLPYRFPGVNILAVEANFQQDILDRCQRMPEKTRHRIACTHMEIDRLCQCLKQMDLSRCRELVLLHLSDATSHEGQFINKVRRAVPPTVKVWAAAR